MRSCITFARRAFTLAMATLAEDFNGVPGNLPGRQSRYFGVGGADHGVRRRHGWTGPCDTILRPGPALPADYLRDPVNVSMQEEKCRETPRNRRR